MPVTVTEEPIGPVLGEQFVYCAETGAAGITKITRDRMMTKAKMRNILLYFIFRPTPSSPFLYKRKEYCSGELHSLDSPSLFDQSPPGATFGNIGSSKVIQSISGN